MAKKFRGFRRKAKSFNRRAGRSYAKASNASLMTAIGGAMIYGALREKASNALAPLTNKIPLGNIADEVVLGVASYFLAKKGSGLVREIGKAGLVIESARIGEAIVNGQLSLGGASAASDSGVYDY